MKKLTFKTGGIHPTDGKHFTADKPSEFMPATEKLRISLLQHLGKVSIPAVEKKSTVEQGQIIGRADGTFSAHIHSPVAGKINDIADAPPPLGRNFPAVEILTNKEVPSKEYPIDHEVLNRLNKEDIIQRIKEAGIVGLGGAMFPTHIKLSPPPDKILDTLIVNGVECEPYITSDYRLILEKTVEITAGIEILNKLIGFKKIWFAIEDNKPDAISLLKKVKSPLFETVVLKTRYPQGGEKQLIEAVTGREVPDGGLPFDIGVLVQNTATLYAIYEAVFCQKPLMQRLITVSGPAVKNPRNLWVKIGTYIHDIINECGGATEENLLVINGGPMMGFALPALDQNTLKGTNAILVFPDKKPQSAKQVFECIRCARCIRSCPIKLMPREIAYNVKTPNPENLKMLYTNSCIECGVCAYVCPAGIPLVQWIRTGKVLIKKK